MNSQPTIRVGVIGTGIMGARHAQIYAQLPHAHLLGVFDPDHARAASIATQFGGQAFPTVEDLLGAVDAVSIVSPTSTHEDVILLALNHDVHVLVEKPMTATYAGAQRIAEQVLQTDKIVQVGHVERFNPVVQELRRQIAGHKVIAATMRRLSPFDRRSLDSTVIQDLMIHDIDLMLDFFGNQLECQYATGGIRRSSKIDYASAHYAAADGPQITLVASRIADSRHREIEVITEDAHIIADLLNRTIVITRYAATHLHSHSSTSILESRRHTVTEEVVVPVGESLRSELAHFLACIREQRRPLVDVEAGMRTMACAATIGALVEAQITPLATDESLVASA
jgi:predicted dehydrogenase